MSLKDTKQIIKDGGGAPSATKKKKKKEEEKAVAVIKDGNTASLKREANGTPTPTPTTKKREFTYDDYINAVASEKAKGMLDRYFKTGEVPSNLPSTLKQRISGHGSPSLAGGVANATGGVTKRDSAQTGNRTPSYAESRQPTPTTTSWSPSLKRDALAAPDYSSPTAAWRNPETFQAIPWSDYEGLNKYDRKAYLKAYAENSQKEKAQRDAIAQAEAQRLNQEKSDKMLADHFYSRMLKGEQIDVSNFDAKTLQNLQQRAYEDYSNGNLSMEKYLLMPIHNFESLDNRQAKVYNGDIDNPTQPLMQTSGFDRYRTERYDYVHSSYVEGEDGSGNASQSDEQSKNNLISPFQPSWDSSIIDPLQYKAQWIYSTINPREPIPEEVLKKYKTNVNPFEEKERKVEIQKNMVGMMKNCLSSKDTVSRLKEINDAYGCIELGADVGEMTFGALYKYIRNGIKESQPPANIGVGTWAKKVDADLKWLDETFEPFLKLTKDIGGSELSNLDLLGLGADVGLGILNNISSGADVSTTIADAFVDFSYAAGGMTAGAAAGSIFPGAGTVIGALIGGLAGIGANYFYDKFTEKTLFYGKSLKNHSKENWREIFDSILPF